MEICKNNDFEGKIIEIPGTWQNPDEYFFKYKSICKGYIIGINLDYNNTGIIISIADKKDKKISIRKFFTYEEIEKFDPEFFEPFNGNILILFKFISRLLLANLVDFEIKQQGNKNLYYLILNCLKDNSLRPIKIDLNDYDDKEIIIDSTPVFKNNFKSINNKAQNYEIELRKIEHEYENSEIYKEIEIKFTNAREKKVYYDYLNSQDIFNRNIPYYQLFNDSIEDVYDDLNIIIHHNNYYFEEHNQSIKYFFKVFNIRKNSTEPYIFIFIEALNRERENYELQSKMKEYFQNKLNMEQKSEKVENIDDKRKEKVKKKIKKIKNNSQMSFLNNFLSMNKNLNSNNDENKNNNEIKIENNEQKNLNQSNNKNDIIEKSKLIEPKFIIKESNINNNINNILNSNLLEKKHEISKDDSRHINQKRYKESTLEMFFGKRKKIEENILSEKKEIILNNNENNNNSNNNDIIKKLSNYSLENKKKSKKEKKEKKEKKDKKKDKKLNINKPKKESNKISEDINMSFKLSNNGQYNINKDKVINAYLSLLYVHPLDKDDEYEIIENKRGDEFYLCKICRKFYNSKILVREHQWIEHLKPFGRKIQNDLKSKNK